MATVPETVYRQALRSKRPQAIWHIAQLFQRMGYQAAARSLVGHAYSLKKVTMAFGADVSVIQARLNALGADPQLTVDGIEGAATTQAIQAFQSAHNIDPDGVVGPITLTALGIVDQPATVSPSGTGIIAVKGLENTSNAFRNKLIQVSNALGINPDWLASAMSFETRGTFSPSVQNPSSGATGLIQFLGSTAKNLGTSLDALKAMTDVEQLDWVHKYFQPYAGHMHSLNDVYLAIFMPSQMGKSSDAIVASEGSAVYDENAGFDTDGKGYFTVGDITGVIHAVYNAGIARGRIPISTAVGGAGLALAAVGIGTGAYLVLKNKRAKR